ncbi:MAG: hypothetical protein QOE86_3257 [Solirubrobacteraceae bacterium]|nr:hypothetical protein [Solirubrobacteraceae bacterium]
MSDFITGLRADLLEAAVREETRPVRRRVAVSWRPALAFAAAVLAILAIAGVLHSVVPQQRAASMRIARELRLGGLPVDAVLAHGGLWVLDARGGLRRVTGGPLHLKTPAAASALVSGPGRLWAIGQDGRQGYWLIGVDGRTGARVFHKRYPGVLMGIAAGETGVWFSDTLPAYAIRLDGRRIRLPDTSYIAAGGGTLWALDDLHGNLSSVDERTGKLLLRIPVLVDPTGSPGSGGHLMAADAGGVWISDPGRDQVVRVTRQGMQKRLEVGPLPGILARRGDTLWVATGDPHREDFQLKRVDLRSGEVSAGIELGAHAPRALEPFAGGCWVVAADGTAFEIRG